MAVIAITNSPAALLAAIRKSINEKQVVTWSYDSVGDFTHDTDQWRFKSWLRPSVGRDRLVFGILGNQNSLLTDSIYGIYHGRFIEMLTTHHANQFTLALATSQFQKPYDMT